MCCQHVPDQMDSADDVGQMHHRSSVLARLSCSQLHIHGPRRHVVVADGQTIGIVIC